MKKIVCYNSLLYAGTFFWRKKCSNIQSCIFPKWLLTKSIILLFTRSNNEFWILFYDFSHQSEWVCLLLLFYQNNLLLKLLNNLVFQLWLLLSVSDTFGRISGTVQKHCAVHYGSTGCLVFKWGVQNWKYFCIEINITKRNYWIFRIGVMRKCQKWVPKLIFFNQKICNRERCQWFLT